jgi:protein tyrosine/serine phosphatase
MTLRRAHIRQSAIFLGVALGLVLCAAGQRGVPAKDGIGNFGQVNERLYRGAQPDTAALKKLKQLGIRTIIDLRKTAEVKTEAAEARLNGLVYTNLPMRGLGRPADDQVTTVLALIETLPAPVFVHCQHGCDRTGTIIACYRVQHDGWSNKLALREAQTYGISKFERKMKNYILKFQKKPKASPGPPASAPAALPASSAAISVPNPAPAKSDER